MNFVKILHTADIHIGAQDSFLGPGAESRRFETLITFERIIDTAVQNDVQLIAIAGDLFDSDTPETVFTDAVFNKIRDCGIKTVYCAGNHDPLNANSPFVNRELPENLFVLGKDDACITFDYIKTRVYGRSFESSFLKGEEEFTIEVPNDDFINIMVQHGELRSDLGSEYNSITPRFVKKSDMDYIALGHIHKRTPIGKIENTHFAYCGCPEGQGFDELDEKGVYMGSVSKGKCDLEFIPVSKREHIHQKIDITNIDDISSHILNTLSNKYPNYSDNLYKIELTGEIDPETEINTTEITARLSEKLYFVKVKDSTEYKINLSALANDPSLKGIFVKNMLLRIEQAEDKELYKKALKLTFNFALKTVVYALLLLIPYFIVSLISNTETYEFFNITIPLWTANLSNIAVFLKSIATVGTVFFMLKYYLAPMLVVADENMDVTEAMHMSVVISKNTTLDFVYLVFSLLGWVLLSLLFIPLIFTLPLFITVYLTVCFCVMIHGRYL